MAARGSEKRGRGLVRGVLGDVFFGGREGGRKGGR